MARRAKGVEPMPGLTRRAFLTVAVLIPAAGWAQAPAVAVPFSSVSVDVSHLRALGSGPFADIVQGAMTDELRRVFADRIGGRGPRLVVRVTGLYLTTLPDGGGHTFRSGGGGGGNVTDSMDGEALVVGARGEILARYPQHNNLHPQGAWYDPLNEQKRADAVARNYAQWLRRHTVP
jgi:hypothetical protein